MRWIVWSGWLWSYRGLRIVHLVWLMLMETVIVESVLRLSNVRVAVVVEVNAWAGSTTHLLINASIQILIGSSINLFYTLCKSGVGLISITTTTTISSRIWWYCVHAYSLTKVSIISYCYIHCYFVSRKWNVGDCFLSRRSTVYLIIIWLIITLLFLFQNLNLKYSFFKL